MRKILLFFISAFMISFFSCTKENSGNPQSPKYAIGKNRFIVNVNGDDREYFVHVPAG